MNQVVQRFPAWILERFAALELPIDFDQSCLGQDHGR
jgi:hypothetical protein